MTCNAFKLLPHKPPMLFVDYVKTDEMPKSAFVRVKPDWIILDEQDELSGAAFFEIMAQGFGLLNAAKFSAGQDTATANENSLHENSSDTESSSLGFLVGVKKFTCSGTAKLGELLQISVANQTNIGPFNVFDAFIYNEQDELLASAQLKVMLATADMLQGSGLSEAVL